MPIQKSYSFAGYTPDYWVVDRVDFVPTTSVVNVQVSLYKDSAAYTALDAPLLSTTIQLTGGDFNFDSVLSTYGSITLATYLSRAIYTFTEEKLITTGILSGGTRV